MTENAVAKNSTPLAPIIVTSVGAAVGVAAGAVTVPLAIASLVFSVPVTIYIRRQERLERVAAIEAQVKLAGERLKHEVAMAKIRFAGDQLLEFRRMVQELASAGIRARVTLDAEGLCVILDPDTAPTLN